MKCKDIMNSKLITCYRNTSIKDVASLMYKNDIGIIPIVYEDTDFIAGVITDRDIVTRVISQGHSIYSKVSDYMTIDYVSVYEDDDISIAVTKMANYQLKRMIVTNKLKQVIGIISLQNISLNPKTVVYLSDMIREISIPNPQVNKPQEFLRCEDFPL